MKIKELGKRVANYALDTAKSKAYWVDTLTASSWFQPLYSAYEIGTGRIDLSTDYNEFIRRRVAGLCIGLATTRPFCKARDFWKHNVWKADFEKPGIKGVAADATFALGVIPPMYFLALSIGSIGSERELSELAQTAWNGAKPAFLSLPFFIPYLSASRKMFKTTPLDQELKRIKEDEK